MKGKIIGIGSALVLAGVAGGLAFGLPSGLTGQDPEAQAAVTPTTATIIRQDLADTERKSGTLGYGADSSAVAGLAGTITALADEGATIKRGKTLYRVDDQPVVLLYGKLPAYRELRNGVEGRDVKQFEQNLRALGYTGFTVDDEFTWDTAEAVMDWQEDLGLPENGVVELGRIVYASAAVRVDGHSGSVGAAVQPGATVLTYTGTERAVTVTMDVNDARLADVGDKVQVELPDGKSVEGTVREIRTVIQAGTNGNEATTQLEVTVQLSDAKAGEGFAQATVDVEFTAQVREKVLTVPVAALLALREGGYGVELVTDDGSEIVAVTTGLFARGMVEVSGDGLTEGATVGMPS